MRPGKKKYRYDYRLLGIRIQEYRQLLGWTFEKLSERIGISKGALHDVEVKERSLSAVQREKLYAVFAGAKEALEETGISFDHSEFRKLAGLPPRSPLAPPNDSLPKRIARQTFITIRRSSRLIAMLLERADEIIAKQYHALYHGEALRAKAEVDEIYDDVISAGFGNNDIAVAKVQAKYGIFRGQAREMLDPWYTKRPQNAIREYNEVQQRYLDPFPGDLFEQNAKLYMLRAQLLREEGRYHESIEQFNMAIHYAKKAGNLSILAAAYRNRAYVYVVQGDEKRWKENLKEAEKVSKANNRLLSQYMVVEGNGNKRLAFLPSVSWPESKRREYAERAIGCFKEAVRLDPDPVLDANMIGIDGHPLVRELSIAQSYLYVEPYVTLNTLERLTEDAEVNLPALIEKVAYTRRMTEQMLARKQGEELPVFDLDAHYPRNLANQLHYRLSFQC